LASLAPWLFTRHWHTSPGDDAPVAPPATPRRDDSDASYCRPSQHRRIRDYGLATLSTNAEPTVSVPNPAKRERRRHSRLRHRLRFGQVWGCLAPLSQR